jgi:hypothetical protein
MYTIIEKPSNMANGKKMTQPNKPISMATGK